MIDPHQTDDHRADGSDTDRLLAQFAQMAAGLAHQVRNPLTIIAGRAELIQRTQDFARVRDCAEGILQEVDRVERSIAMFLRLAEPVAFNPRPCEARIVLDLALPIIRESAEKRGLRVVTTHADRGSIIHADRRLLADALAELIKNAIEASPNGAELRIETRCSDGHVVFAVSDEGPGVKPSTGKDPFRPFYTTKHDADGFGLALARRNAIIHRGSVDYVNRDVAGAVFELSIPLRPDGRNER